MFDKWTAISQKTQIGIVIAFIIIIIISCIYIKIQKNEIIKLSQICEVQKKALECPQVTVKPTVKWQKITIYKDREVPVEVQVPIFVEESGEISGGSESKPIIPTEGVQPLKWGISGGINTNKVLSVGVDRYIFNMASVGCSIDSERSIAVRATLWMK